MLDNDNGYSLYLLCESFISLMDKSLSSGEIDLETYHDLTHLKSSFIREYLEKSDECFLIKEDYPET